MTKFNRLLGTEALLDADRDGRSTLLEWRQGTNPLSADVAPQPSIRLTPGGCDLYLKPRVGWIAKQSIDGLIWTAAPGSMSYDQSLGAMVHSVPHPIPPRILFRLELPWPTADTVPPP